VNQGDVAKHVKYIQLLNILSNVPLGIMGSLWLSRTRRWTWFDVAM